MHDNATKKHVDSAQATPKSALKYWQALTPVDGSYFGLVNKRDECIQFMWNEDGTVTFDMPIPSRGGSYHKDCRLEECSKLISEFRDETPLPSTEGMVFELFDKPLVRQHEGPIRLDTEVMDLITLWVRKGFYDKHKLRTIVCDDQYEGKLDPAEVAAAIDLATATLESEQSSWPAVTDCDRLDAAFDALNRRGVIAQQNSGYFQSDGYDDFEDAYKLHPNKSSVIGYCYYGEQDLERAMEGGGLSFYFGPANPKDEDTIGLEIGKIVREELERAGLQVKWSGLFAERINIPSMVWQKRRAGGSS